MKELGKRKIINYKEHQFRMLKSDQARSKFSSAEKGEMRPGLHSTYQALAKSAESYIFYRLFKIPLFFTWGHILHFHT